MAYLIRRKESVADEVRRILVEQNRKALSLLERWQQNPRAHVHYARQTFKRLRALLRLIRPGARYVYEVENAFYRDLARSLAYVRDAEAIIEALAVIEAGLSESEAIDSLQRVRGVLEQRAARELASPVLDVPARVGKACDALQAAEERLARTPLPDLGRRQLRRSARKCLRRCEERFGRALLSGDAADFHQWRQEVKYAYHQTRLMQDLAPDWASAYGPDLARLGQLLGHSQDLAVLDAVLGTTRASPADAGHLLRLREIVGADQRAVREQARQLGIEIFLLPARGRGGEAAIGPAPVIATPATPGTTSETPAAPSGNVVDLGVRRASGEDLS